MRHGRRVPYQVASSFHRFANRLGMAAGDGSHFGERKAFHPIEQKRFAIGAIRLFESSMHQRKHLVRVPRLLGIGDAAIGNRAFPRPALVGLVESVSWFTLL